jgi:hypothetical protein
VSDGVETAKDAAKKVENKVSDGATAAKDAVKKVENKVSDGVETAKNAMAGEMEAVKAPTKMSATPGNGHRPA